MLNQSVFTLINPQNSKLALRHLTIEDDCFLRGIQRNDFFSLIWIVKGTGTVDTNFDKNDFGDNTFFAFAPYQPFSFSFDGKITGFAIYFHPDFFCIHKHDKEVESNGVLFNNVYSKPFVNVDENLTITLSMLFDQIKEEMQNSALAQHDVLVSYLKIILITASRLKLKQTPQSTVMATANKDLFTLQKLKNAIEENFKIKHSPSDYTKLLNISAKTLASIAKANFNRSLSTLINERIIIEAKRELYVTDKAVKLIAYELGYKDEYYFSRFFKINTSVSPQYYRDTVGFAKGVQPQSSLN
ncbi:helix-turn-helix domain-containing protein [Mucilaginibacter gotjawali]|uniref:HTH-type transcriptional activator Btr n=2 Tax=Mucilaginibacter gotjawali TaxID=1550579 RepID=A0A120MXQ0_9SPHI|nr:helix-turn-helix domain-containing protein [Mucilaginibacter gotjawali]MBB3054245.1 AraC-like DNA-binding protein [Mucilaginibacter gotjawali]BAU51922.1 HTH-type transcriptional activator Btr [Mucilaginibacter gotjawali]